ncbi:MAG: LCP family protein [Clostridia bacterium]|nr:LCP family protein [Clostridia bacterium]
MAHRHRKHRRQKGYDGGKPPRDRLLLMALLTALLFAAGLMGVSYIGQRLEPDAEEVRGSLEGRFQPTLTLEHKGRTYAHQELDYTTILFIGVDKSALNSVSMRQGGQADFLLLMTIDRDHRQVDLLQLDRDTIAEVQVYGAFGNPAGKRNTQICLSYAFGTTTEKACQNTVRAVTDLLGGIPIDHYIALDMDGMTVLNDALGGVTVTLEEDFTDLDPAMKAGTAIKLQGRQAEYFLRSRMTVGDGTNQGRMNRQAAFMEAAAELLTQRMAEDPEYVGELLEALEEHLVASCENGWLVSQAYAARQYTRTKLARLQGEHTVGSDGFVEFHPDTDALTEYIIGTFCE